MVSVSSTTAIVSTIDPGLLMVSCNHPMELYLVEPITEPDVPKVHMPSIPVDLVFGVMDTKNWRGMLDLLIPHIGNWYIVKPQASRAVEPQLLVDYLSGKGISSVANFKDDYVSLLQCLNENPSDRPLVISGSAYLIGELRAHVVQAETPLWYKRVNSQAASA